QTAKTHDEANAETNMNLVDFNCEAQQRALESLAYSTLVHDVCDDVISDKSTLADGVDRLISSEPLQDPRRQRSITATRMGASLRECLALQIMQFVQKRETYVALKAA